jgi:hypothetical protein
MELVVKSSACFLRLSFVVAVQFYAFGGLLHLQVPEVFASSVEVARSVQLHIQLRLYLSLSTVCTQCNQFTIICDYSAESKKLLAGSKSMAL